MKAKCNECGTEFDFDKSQVQEMWVKKPRRANDLTNIALDELVVGHGYELVHFVACPCGNNVFIKVKNDGTRNARKIRK